VDLTLLILTEARPFPIILEFLETIPVIFSFFSFDNERKIYLLETESDLAPESQNLPLSHISNSCTVLIFFTAAPANQYLLQKKLNESFSIVVLISSNASPL
jgi:hypothetical protein